VLAIVGDLADDDPEEVFDRWVADPTASFQAAEVGGEVAAVQRLRPIAPRVLLYEWLAVAQGRQRQGIARSMVRQALEEARQLGIGEVRLLTRDPVIAHLAETEGFRLAARSSVWTAGRLEGDDLPRLATAEQAEALAERFRADLGLAAYGGIEPDPQTVAEVDAALLQRYARVGRLRVGPQRAALALVGEIGRSRLSVTLLLGSGGALQELLTQLRYEADLHGLAGVSVLLPDRHPAIDDLPTVGYDLALDEAAVSVYRREL
jgi:GNAT superfamily N-acetyltransferase